MKCGWPFANIFGKKIVTKFFVGTISSQIAFSKDQHQGDNNQNWNKNFIAFIQISRSELYSQRSHRRLWSSTRSPLPSQSRAPWWCRRQAHRTSSSHPLLGGRYHRLSASFWATRVRLFRWLAQCLNVAEVVLFLAATSPLIGAQMRMSSIGFSSQVGGVLPWPGTGVMLVHPHIIAERRWESNAAAAAHATQVMVAFQNNIRTLMDTAPTRTLLVFESHRLQEPPESGVGNCKKVLDVLLASLENRRHRWILLVQEEGVNFPAHTALHEVIKFDSLPSTDLLSWRVFRHWPRWRLTANLMEDLLGHTQRFRSATTHAGAMNLFLSRFSTSQNSEQLKIYSFSCDDKGRPLILRGGDAKILTRRTIGRRNCHSKQKAHGWKRNPVKLGKTTGKQAVDAHAQLPLQKWRDPSHVPWTKNLWRRWKWKVQNETFTITTRFFWNSLHFILKQTIVGRSTGP